MAAQPTFDPDDGIWVIRLSETISLDDVLEASRTIDASEQSRRSAPRLWDARLVAEGPSIGRDGLRGLAGGTDAKEASGRVAVVVHRDVDFGMARMYSAYVDEFSAEVRVYRDFDEAVRWLTEG
jgi:hypothetical protein